MSSSNLPVKRPSGAYYAVQLEGSDYRSWEDIGERTSRLTFHWEKMNANIYGTLQKLLIAVAKTHTGYDDDYIMEKAKTIRQTKHIHRSDYIFGVKDQSLNKVGFVADTSLIDLQELSLTINWVSEESVGEISGNIFKENLEIQKLNGTELNRIEKQVGNSLQLAYTRLPDHQNEEWAFSESYKTGKAENILSVEKAIDDHKEDKGGLITVFYGTNRNSLGEKDGRQCYGDDDTDQLRYGTCDVELPRNHKQGELERPGKFLWIFPQRENEEKHFIISRVKEMDGATFLTDFAKRISEKPKKHALLFVHGYRCTFEDAAYRTAQLAWDIPFSGYAGFYSWPSAGEYLKYPADGAAARSCVPFLKQLIANILTHQGVEQLHIIAHSMGSLVLTLTMKEIAADTSLTNYLDKIYQLILGAPDIDAKEFRNTIMPKFNATGQRRTIYASDHDLALFGSSFARSSRERLGRIGKDIFVAPGLDTVEASNLKTPSSHSYLFESKIVPSDIYYLLTKDLPPNERRLREITNSPLNYWLFPK
jgi:esterase/lipase superfamily enzyme